MATTDPRPQPEDDPAPAVPWPDRAPGMVCSRWIGSFVSFGGHPCGRPATHHVLWDWDTGENGLVCADHVAEVGTRWPYFDKHAYDPICSIGGVVWVIGHPSRCELDELPVLEHALSIKDQNS